MLILPPRLWTPRPREIVPARRPVAPWRRPPLRQPRRHSRRCPLYAMADGDSSMDANGDEVIDASGDEFVKCCCGLYVQARACVGHADVDLWFQYRVSGGVPQLLDVSTGTWVNLSFYFSISTTRYYVDSTCNVAATAGTMASGYTVRGGCQTCTTCTGDHPAEYLAVFAGITPCLCAFNTNDFEYESLVGDPNGSYVVRGGSNCACAGTSTVQWKSDSPSCGTPLFTPSGSAVISVNLNTGRVVYSIGNTASFGVFRDIFVATFTPTTCTRTISGLANLHTVCLGNLGGTASQAIATGGTVDLIPL